MNKRHNNIPLKILEFKTDPENKKLKLLDKKGKDYLNDGGCDNNVDILAQEINSSLEHYVIDKVIPDNK